MRAFVKGVALLGFLVSACTVASAQEVTELGVAKFGTPEAKRLTDLKALARAGLVPVHQLGGVPSVNVAESNLAPTAIVTSLVPHPKARGEMLRFQQRFATAFSKQDLPSVARIAHFSWLPHFDHVRQIGWYGSVVDSVIQPDGTVIVTVKVSPHLASPIMKTLVLDYVTEVYAVSEGLIYFLDTDAETPKPQLQTFPIH